MSGKASFTNKWTWSEEFKAYTTNIWGILVICDLPLQQLLQYRWYKAIVRNKSQPKYTTIRCSKTGNYLDRVVCGLEIGDTNTVHRINLKGEDFNIYDARRGNLRIC